jgi:hypothetical protein
LGISGKSFSRGPHQEEFILECQDLLSGLFIHDFHHHMRNGVVVWQRIAQQVGSKRPSTITHNVEEDRDFDVDFDDAGNDDGHNQSTLHVDDDEADAVDEAKEKYALSILPSNFRTSEIFGEYGTLVAVSASKHFAMWCVPDVRIAADGSIRRCPVQVVFCGKINDLTWCECDYSSLQFCDINLLDDEKIDRILAANKRCSS